MYKELIAKIDQAWNEDDWVWQAMALRNVVKYAEELSQTDYRGNPPVEHYIARKIFDIVQEGAK